MHYVGAMEHGAPLETEMYKRPAPEIDVRDFCGRDELVVTQRDHTAHWESLNCAGWWQGRFRVESNGRISIDITEQGRKSHKRVMVELPAEAVAQLRVILDATQKKAA